MILPKNKLTEESFQNLPVPQAGFKFWKLLVITFVCTFSWTCTSSIEQENAHFPIIRNQVGAHAHNDYRQEHPLYDALNNGFISVEADILYKDGQLYVGHDKEELENANLSTLESLYLQPLYQHFQNNRNSIYPNYDGLFYLWIDIKYAADTVYPILKETLLPYRSMLSHYQNGKIHKGKMVVILSGDRPFDLVLRDSIQLMTLDGRLGDIEKPYHFTKVENSKNWQVMPFISENYRRIFSLDPSGRLLPNEFQKLKTFVDRCHKSGRKVRLWAMPEDERLWSKLIEAGVDLINTDELGRLRRFLKGTN